jgi:hypothetical protein
MPAKAAIKSGIVPHAEADPDQFYIPARAPVTRARRTLKHDDSFLVLDSHGDIGASSGEADGLFDHDTRYLARLELSIGGATPLLLGFNLRDDNLIYTVDLTNPDVYKDNRVVFEKARCTSCARPSCGSRRPINGSPSRTRATTSLRCGSRWNLATILPTCSRRAA